MPVLPPNSGDPALGVSKVKSLEKLAMASYLSFLEDACAVYIRLVSIDSYLIKEVRDNMINVLKNQLERNLHGTMSTSLRQEMIRAITRWIPSSSKSRHNSGGLQQVYPSEKFHNQYKVCPGEHEEHLDSEADNETLAEVKKHGKKCCSVCCTGAFITETMLCILMNEDVREILFDGTTNKRFWHKSKPLAKFVPFMVPGTLAHFSTAVTNSSLDRGKKPQLERFSIRYVDISTRSYAMKNGFFDVLTMHDEAMKYLEIPGVLSQASGEFRTELCNSQ